ncbi:uncharacterized protein BO72DRAFT_366391 [Aspergillus fijiensis CBS 313.89]|uniref:Rhodopsin domain-containing protein n=1 Tax=Aspergillus fijiensis CBS 313.89 TaxID=1448319 RepID=A0A8G1S145_9EURO|nr:uncharacterized protein BO72DRAFT_366391 [Aspergillus fijiensis CBS 313.89]RAK82497.1 hypothetical protein BO72DRAFT_366391 [Aspergillus fijiensis CBS 313.89]
MGDFSPPPYQLLSEAIIFWSVATVLYIGRIVSRVIVTGSIKRLYSEDYVMSVTFLIYTTLLVLIQVSARYASNLVDPAQYDEIMSNPQEVRDRIFGSKIVIGLEQCMLFSTWGVKVCMLTMFWRLTQNFRLLRMYVNLIAAFIAVGFLVIMVTYYAVYCRPFSQYWAMPVQDMQCATYQYYSITQAVFNISSDAAMLALPFPLLRKAQMRRGKKIMLAGVMSLGVFTIAAAILNKVFNFASPLTTTYQIWYIREASTAIYVANMVCLSPLIRRVFSSKMYQKTNRPHGQHARWHGIDPSSVSRSAQSGGKPRYWHPFYFSHTYEWKPDQFTMSVKGKPHEDNLVDQRTSEEAIIRTTPGYPERTLGPHRASSYRSCEDEGQYTFEEGIELKQIHMIA